MSEWCSDPGTMAGVLERPTGATETSWREGLSLVWVVTWREIRDTLRDWRLVAPILLLTLVFPIILNFGAKLTLNFVRRYNASIIGEQSIPFLLLVVGFFPISFSLVIALETFVGEKERKSLEPLLATPLSNTQLYLGKTLAAMIPPVVASYLGIALYLFSLFLTIDYRPPVILVLQVMLLTTAEALVMVSGAVIVSSQTTSVRAANLLASFIILPMAFLVQAEAVILFWSRYELLWIILMALVVVDLILVRMGTRIFNREDLLGREVDSLNLRHSWRLFKRFLLNSSAAQEAEGGPKLLRFYRRDLPELLRVNKAALAVVSLSLVAALVMGWLFAVWYPLPAEIFSVQDVSRETFDQFESVGFLPSFSTWGILTHNVRSLLLAAGLALFSFGALAILLLMVPIVIIGFLMGQMALAGYSPLLFFAAFVLPHGVVELPAAILATALALRLGAAIMAPPPGMTVGQTWLQALARFIKGFVLLVLPLLVVAAFIEVNITPQVVLAIYGN